MIPPITRNLFNEILRLGLGHMENLLANNPAILTPNIASANGLSKHAHAALGEFQIQKIMRGDKTDPLASIQASIVQQFRQVAGTTGTTIVKPMASGISLGVPGAMVALDENDEVSNRLAAAGILGKPISQLSVGDIEAALGIPIAEGASVDVPRGISLSDVLEQSSRNPIEEEPSDGRTD